MPNDPILPLIFISLPGEPQDLIFNRNITNCTQQKICISNLTYAHLWKLGHVTSKVYIFWILLIYKHTNILPYSTNVVFHQFLHLLELSMIRVNGEEFSMKPVSNMIMYNEKIMLCVNSGSVVEMYFRHNICAAKLDLLTFDNWLLLFFHTERDMSL